MDTGLWALVFNVKPTLKPLLQSNSWNSLTTWPLLWVWTVPKSFKHHSFRKKKKNSHLQREPEWRKCMFVLPRSLHNFRTLRARTKTIEELWPLKTTPIFTFKMEPSGKSNFRNTVWYYSPRKKIISKISFKKWMKVDGLWWKMMKNDENELYFVEKWLLSNF